MTRHQLKFILFYFTLLMLLVILALYSSQDTRIKQLEEQTAILKASSSSGSFHSTSELQQHCLALQEQVDEMEVCTGGCTV